VLLNGFYKLSNCLLNEGTLFFVIAFKTVYFIYLVFVRIKELVHKDFYFYELMFFIGLSVILIISSFANDFYCLIRLD
jgi:hypothetical protein